MIEFRQFREEDSESISSIMKEYPLQFPPFVIDRYPLRWSQFKANESKSNYYVATELNEVIGHSGFIYNSEVNMYEIVGVVVSKNYARRGIGRELLEIISSSINVLGGQKVILYTLGHPENQGTINFYKSIGFELVNFEENFFDQGYSRVTFLKELEN
ncbi:GNAT family N-acetyltransferase [Paenibacillus sp. GCM10028914]|uniref:GNAT family N-acetyltransferase n=1 Tax=Paenibacillus sp. GCM10028914 TaxID=3273416 RepID=UPI0036214F93